MEDVFIVIFVVVVREFVGDWLVYCCSYLDDVRCLGYSSGEGMEEEKVFGWRNCMNNDVIY